MQRASLYAATALSLISSAPRARADVTSATFAGTGDYSYAVKYMTDLDQKRDQLPNDGKMYCVPTASMNLLGYAANFGFPGLLPGPGVWEGVAGYDEMTVYLAFMGLFMGTDAEDGTGGTGWVNGLESWIAQSGIPMSVVSVFRDDDFWPNVDVAAFMGVAGAVVDFAYGRYEFSSGPGGDPLLGARKNGHAVTLSRAVASNGQHLGPRQIHIRNPGSPDDGDLDANSSYASQDLSTAVNMQVWRDQDGDGSAEAFQVTSLNNPPPDDGRMRVLDSIIGLYPPGGMAYTGVQVSAQFAGGGLGFVNAVPPAVHDVAPGAGISSLTLHPELHSALGLVHDSSGRALLVQFPNAAPAALPLLDLPAGTRHLVLGHGHEVFAIGAGQALRLRVQHGRAARVQGVRLPEAAGGSVDAAAYQESSGEILLLSLSQRRLFVLDGRTLEVASSHVVPGGLAASAARSLVVERGTDGRFIAVLGDGSLAEGRLGPPASRAGHRASADVRFRPLPLPRVRNALSVDIDGRGRLYVADADAGLLEFERGDSGRWQPSARPLYAKHDLRGRRFVVMKSRSNVRRELHDTPEWNNIDPDVLLPLGPEVAD